jgi:hypothetical protein
MVLIDSDNKPLLGILQKPIMQTRHPAIHRRRLLWVWSSCTNLKKIFMWRTLSAERQKNNNVLKTPNWATSMSRWWSYHWRGTSHEKFAFATAAPSNFGYGKRIGSKKLTRTQEELSSLLDASSWFEWKWRSSAWRASLCSNGSAIRVLLQNHEFNLGISKCLKRVKLTVFLATTFGF